MTRAITLFPQPVPGATFPVNRAPKFSQMSQRSASGRTIHALNQLFPTYEWTLTYEVMRDPYDVRATQLVSQFPNEFRALFSFYNTMAGSALPFLFFDPTDGLYVKGPSGVTDGTSTEYYTYRALFTDGLFEPIHAALFSPTSVHAAITGIPVDDLAFHVYLDTDLIDPSDYTPLPHNGWDEFVYGIKFNSPPAAGKFIFFDMAYWWPCHFSTDSNDFSYFLANRWGLRELKFESFLLSQTNKGI